MEYPTFSGQYSAIEEFDRPAASWLLGSTTATGGAVVRSDAHGGQARLSVTAAATAGVSLATQLILRPDNGARIDINTMVKLSNLAAASFFFGISRDDDVAVHIENEDGTLAAGTNVWDAAGFLLEGEEEAEFKAIARNNSVFSALMDLPAVPAPVVDKWMRLGISVYASGTVQFRVGNQQVLEITKAVRPKQDYSVVLGIDGRDTAYNCDVNYIAWNAPRINDFLNGY